MTVVTVGSCLKVAVIWSNMFIPTLVQSHTHVNTVQNVLHGLTNSRHICWSHTMKVLGSHVTFVRRNSPAMVTLRDIYFAMAVWSRMFDLNVQSVSVQQLNWNVMHWNIQMSNYSAVVYVLKISNINDMFQYISRDVPLDWDLLVGDLYISCIYLLIDTNICLWHCFN